MKNDLWFTTSRVRVHLSNQDNAGRLSIMEHVMDYGFSPPLHVHHAEDETFHVLEGRFLFEADGKSRVAETGDTIHVAAGTAHSFLVTSPSGGRFLTITQGGFEDMVRETSRPVTGNGVPAAAPTPAEQHAFASAALRNGIELVGGSLAG